MIRVITRLVRGREALGAATPSRASDSLSVQDLRILPTFCRQPGPSLFGGRSTTNFLLPAARWKQTFVDTALRRGLSSQGCGGSSAHGTEPGCSHLGVWRGSVLCDERDVLPLVRLHVSKRSPTPPSRARARQEVEHGHGLHLRAGYHTLVGDGCGTCDGIRPVIAWQSGNVRRVSQRHGRHVPGDVADVV